MGYFERRRTKKTEKRARKAAEAEEAARVQRQQYENAVLQRVQDFGISRELAAYLLKLETKVEYLEHHVHHVTSDYGDTKGPKYNRR